MQLTPDLCPRLGLGVNISKFLSHGCIIRPGHVACLVRVDLVIPLHCLSKQIEFWQNLLVGHQRKLAERPNKSQPFPRTTSPTAPCSPSREHGEENARGAASAGLSLLPGPVSYGQCTYSTYTTCACAFGTHLPRQSGVRRPSVRPSVRPSSLSLDSMRMRVREKGEGREGGREGGRKPAKCG